MDTPQMPPTTPVESPTMTPAPLKQSHANMIAFIIVIVAVLLGGGVFAYFASDLFGPKDPYTVMDQMFEALETVTSAETTVALTISADMTPIMAAEAAALAEYESKMSAPSSSQPEPGSIDWMLQPARPDTTFTDLGMEEVAIAFEATTFSNSKHGKDARMSGALSIDSPVLAATINHRVIGTDLYVQLAKFSASIPTAPGAPSFPIDMFVAPYLNTWVAIKQDEISEFVPFQIPAKDNTTLEEAGEAIREKIPAMRAAFETHKPLILTEVAGDKSQYTYTVDIDMPAMRAFLTEVSEAVDAPEIRSKQQINEIMDALEMLEENEIAQQLTMTLAVDKKTFLPVSLTLAGAITPPADAIPYNVENFSLDVRFVVGFGRYNEFIEVTAPSESVSMQEIMMGLMGGNMMMGDDMGMMLEAPDDSMMMVDEMDYFGDEDTDGDGLPDALELQIGSDPLNSDTDGDGYGDMEEFENGYDLMR